jgi:hypothetical protein
VQSARVLVDGIGKRPQPLELRSPQQGIDVLIHHRVSSHGFAHILPVTADFGTGFNVISDPRFADNETERISARFEGAV